MANRNLGAADAKKAKADAKNMPHIVRLVVSVTRREV
jgi:hypothetical protein